MKNIDLKVTLENLYQPKQLFSLLEMIHFFAGYIANVLENISMEETRIGKILKEHGNEITVSGDDKSSTIELLSFASRWCKSLKLEKSDHLISRAMIDDTYDEWSHIVTLCYAQVTHSIGLNDVCDALQLNSGPLSAIRGATPPTRNNSFAKAWMLRRITPSVCCAPVYWPSGS